MLSVITTGRDDNYGDHFVESMAVSLKNTINYLDCVQIKFEIVVIDWSPHDKKFLSENVLLKDIRDDHRVKFSVVDSDIVSKRGLNSKNFYEYFAKNAGVRRSQFEWVLIQNPDILISPGIASNLSQIIAESDALSQNIFYRFNNRIETSLSKAEMNSWMNGKIQNLDNPRNKDNHVLGAYGGDILFVSKRVFCDIGKGYNESNSIYKSQDLRQSTMDSEILINMHKNGAKMKLINDVYGHIEHGHPVKRCGDLNYLNNHYENDPDWGFWD